VLYFSAEPGTPLARLVEEMVRVPRIRTGSSAAESGERTRSFYDTEMRSDGSPDETKVGHDRDRGGEAMGASPETEKSAGWNGQERHIVDPREQQQQQQQQQEEQDDAALPGPSQNLNRPSAPPPSSKNRRAVYVEEHRHLSTIYDQNTESTSENDSAALFPFKVRARSDWIPRSPSELSFQKGDVLHSAEKEGKKWWKVRKADGSVGMAPSNYFKVVNS